MDRLFCFENGRLQRFEGNYSAYLERQQALSRGDGTRAAGGVGRAGCSHGTGVATLILRRPNQALPRVAA